MKNNSTIRKDERTALKMGLAASQARLLTITARLADNELRSQTINNAKMRLATQSSQASDEYVSALNNAQLMFSNTDINGLARSQALTFNNLISYSQYNNQYGLVNSAGLLLVNEKDAAIYERHKNDLEGFLGEYGLKWDTTFFDDSQGKDKASSTELSDKLVSFYGTGHIDNNSSKGYNFGELFKNMTNEQLENLYLKSLTEEASIEKMNYDVYSKAYYNTVKLLYSEAIPKFKEKIFGGSNSMMLDEIANYVASNAASKPLGQGDDYVRDYLYGRLALSNYADRNKDGSKTTADMTYCYNNISQYLTSGGKESLKEMLDSLMDINSSNKAGFRDKTLGYSEISSNDGNKEITIAGIKIFIDVGGVTRVDEGTFGSDGYDGTYDEDVLNKLNNYLSSKHLSNFQGSQLKTTLNDIANLLSSKCNYSEMDNANCMYRYDSNNDVIYRIPLDYSTRQAAYKAIVMEYLNSIQSMAFLDPTTLDSQTLQASKNNFSQYDTNPVYGTRGNGALEGLVSENPSYLQNFPGLVAAVGSDIYNYGSDAFKSVLNTYLAELMLDVLGEPKYSWVDENDPSSTQNSDSKAQWYSNLFNRMQKGYKVLENGLANSQEWIEYAFETGLVTMEQVDKSFNWVGLDYKTCANIYENSDNSDAVAKAEAKYNRAMNDIKQKDSMYDLQLKNIDTEHQSLQTEYDSVKGVMNKNIERTMKFDQSA